MAIYKLRDLFEITGGSTPSTKQKDLWDGNVLWYTPIDLNINKHTMRKIKQSIKTLPKGSVMISSRAPIGYINVSAEECWHSQGVKGFKNKDESLIKNKYFKYLLKTQINYLRNAGAGSTFKEISKHYLENFEVDIPEIEEQNKIIDIIEQKEELFIKYSNTIRIDTYNHCKHDMIKLIDIIEPIERIIQNIIFQNEKIDQIILSFDPKGNISKCSDIANIKTGKRNANHSRTNGKYNFYTCSDRVMKCDEYSFDSESLLVAGNGNVGNVKYFNGKFDAYQRTYVITFKEFIGTAYLSFLKNQKILSNSSQGSVIKYLVLKDIQNIEVVLDQEVNKKIVDLLRIKLINEKMLSNFENLLNTTIKKMIV